MAWMNRWNQTPGNHPIVASTWFVYDGGNGSGTWDNNGGADDFGPDHTTRAILSAGGRS